MGYKVFQMYFKIKKSRACFCESWGTPVLCHLKVTSLYIYFKGQVYSVQWYLGGSACHPRPAALKLPGPVGDPLFAVCFQYQWSVSCGICSRLLTSSFLTNGVPIVLFVVFFAVKQVLWNVSINQVSFLRLFLKLGGKNCKGISGSIHLPISSQMYRWAMKSGWNLWHNRSTYRPS